MLGKCEGTLQSVYLLIAQLGTPITLQCPKSYPDQTAISWDWQRDGVPASEAKFTNNTLSWTVTQSLTEKESKSVYTCEQLYVKQKNTIFTMYLVGLGK